MEVRKPELGLMKVLSSLYSRFLPRRSATDYGVEITAFMTLVWFKASSKSVHLESPGNKALM